MRVHTRTRAVLHSARAAAGSATAGWVVLPARSPIRQPGPRETTLIRSPRRMGRSVPARAQRRPCGAVRGGGGQAVDPALLRSPAQQPSARRDQATCSVMHCVTAGGERSAPRSANACAASRVEREESPARSFSPTQGLLLSSPALLAARLGLRLLLVSDAVRIFFTVLRADKGPPALLPKPAGRSWACHPAVSWAAGRGAQPCCQRWTEGGREGGRSGGVFIATCDRRVGNR